MKTILVDDELWSMEQFRMECGNSMGICVVGEFNEPLKALEYVKNNLVEFALLDVEMPQMNGIELGKELRKIYPDMVIIYVTSYKQYISEAIFSVEADYFVLKPYNKKDIESVMKRAVNLSSRQKKRIVVQTFGRFDVFVDGQLLHFTNAKAKELLALCVDCLGGEVWMEQAINALWEGREYDNKVKNLYRKAIIYLNTIFRLHNLENVFESKRGCCHIQKEEITCDYYEYLKGVRNEIHKNPSEYMIEYSWAEITAGRIQRFVE